jgi:RNA recognition motif-containing protein
LILSSRNISVSHHHHTHSQHHRRNSSGGELHAAIKIRNLPLRSSDTSLKDGLYHEYKKHGKVAWVRVCGVAADRFAIVCFKSTEHAARAVSSSQDKQFFGCKIQVTPYHHKTEDIVGASEEETR